MATITVIFVSRRDERCWLLWPRRVKTGLRWLRAMLHQRRYGLRPSGLRWKIHPVQMHKVLSSKGNNNSRIPGTDLRNCYYSQVLEFVDEHGNEVLNLGSFTLLPQHVVRLILARDELRADEFTKFQAALMWGKKYCDNNPNTALKDVIGNFLEYIQFHKIPANVLMREVHPLGLVPYSIIMNALAYQVQYKDYSFSFLSGNFTETCWTNTSPFCWILR